MGKKVTAIIMAAIFCILIAGVAMAAPKIYVKDNYVGTGVKSRGTVYVDLENFLRKGGYNWKMSGTSLLISDGRGGGLPMRSIPKRFNYKGRSFNAHSLRISTRLYTRADALAGGLKLMKHYTPAVKTTDYFLPGANPPDRTPKPTPTKKPGKDDGKAPGGEPGDKKAKWIKKEFKGPESKIGKSLVKPTLDYFYDFQSGEVRGNVMFTNTADEELKKVKVTFSIVDGYDKSLWQKNFNLGDMKAGDKTKKTDFYWINPAKLEIFKKNFYYHITYEQKEKKKK